VNSSIEVAVDPATAFKVFTEELDCWWIQGPINFFDTARAYYMRMEPGVGGRIVEVYDEKTGDGLELARITVWEPGKRVAWTSSLDDVEIDIRFEKSAGGTEVRVQATIPEGGADKGGTAWVRMSPVWLNDWIRKRDHVPHEPLRLARLAVVVHYAKPAAAGRWLRDVFGFEPAGNVPEVEPDDPSHTWIEFHVGNCSIILWGREAASGAGAPITHTPFIYVDDLDAHFAHAKAHGAEIIQDIHQQGFRAYEAADPEGNRWTFAQASPLMR
jgi:uncharacterized glyoxalase superfamily protein PhnB